jgi:hypothetical protein
MGIKSLATKAAGKVGNGIAKAASLSPEQLEEVEEKRKAYLSEMPKPDDPAARELTERLLAAGAVEIYNAYLPQLEDLYVPLDPAIEYPDGFNPAYNIATLNITKWVFDREEDSLDKLVNVYNVLSNDSCNIALIFDRRMKGADVYIAISNTENASNKLDISSYRDRIESAIKGNFPGSVVSECGFGSPGFFQDKSRVSVATVSNIPSGKSDSFATQTIEKILDGYIPGSAAEEYTIILMATPVLDSEDRKLALSKLASSLKPYESWQTNYTVNESSNIGSSATLGVNAGVSVGYQFGTSTFSSTSSSSTDSTGSSYTESNNETQSSATTTSESTSLGESTSSAKGTNESSTGGASVSASIGTPIGGASLGGFASHSEGSFQSTTIGESTTSTTGTSDTTSLAKTIGEAIGKTLGKAVTEGTSTGQGAQNGASAGANFGMNFARSSNVVAMVGKNEGITQTFSNHAVAHALELLTDQMKRYDSASALGAWDFAAYVLSENIEVANNVAHAYLALTQGDESYLSRASVNLWRGDIDQGSNEARTICSYLKDMRQPVFGLNPNVISDGTESFAVYPAVVTATTTLTGKELSRALNFPKTSIMGLPVIECTSFGRNVLTYDSVDNGVKYRLGNLYHMHHEENAVVALSKKSLTGHLFITGSTGAGKTNAVCKLLDDAIEDGVGFLVVEPAKGEYKNIFGGREGVYVFGTNIRKTPLLKINPFSFPSDIHVLEHIDRLVEIFNVCWPMYAAMPAILKESIERSYMDCGWNLDDSTNPYGEDLFPQFDDVARNIRLIIDSSEYDSENKGAYKGSLLTRLQSLCNGINGQIFTNAEINPSVLFDSRTIVDLSRVGSSETNSLIMGLLVMKLQEYRISENVGFNGELRHLTVLEEAHNLLKRCSQSQSPDNANVAGKSVEMLANSIAEMRAYGEGFVIADQAPELLDMSAIRNTNTKIILRLPDQSDRELVGHTADLTQEQIGEIARLPQGVAVVYQNDWIEAVLCKIDRAEDAVPLAYDYIPADSSVNEADRLSLLSILSGGDALETPNIERVEAMLARLEVPAYERVLLSRGVFFEDGRPRMTQAARILKHVLPKTYSEFKKSYTDGLPIAEWTEYISKLYASEVQAVEAEVFRQLVVQAIVTQVTFNEMHRADTLGKWSELFMAENGGSDVVK